MEKLFKLKKYNTTVGTEVMAGLTTFFAMSYILIVNPGMLSSTGMPWGGVYLATIIASIIGTLIMGLFANVPYATAPGMGLNALFAFTVVGALGYTWQQALAMVFICGLINVIITVTKLRKHIISAIPESLQHAISGGIGIFIAYIGLINAGVIVNAGGADSLLPEFHPFSSPATILAMIGIVITIVLVVKNVKGALLISILLTSLIGLIPYFGQTQFNADNTVSLAESIDGLMVTFGAAFGQEGLGSLFTTDLRTTLLAISTIFVLSLSDTFDTIGTFIGTGRSSGIFTEAEEETMMKEAGFSTRLDKALFADSIATSIGAILGTSNTTTYVESSAGIGAGGRTGLASVVTAALFFVSIFVSQVASAVPGAATAPILIIVGIMMLSSFTKIKWDNMAEAIPAFFTALIMGFAYSITTGIALGFLAYIIVKLALGKIRDIHPIIWGAGILFILDFVIRALTII